MLKRKKLPSQADLKRLLRYDPESGFLYWRERPVTMFSPAGHGGSKAQADSWNTRYANKRAGTEQSAGYRSLNLKSLKYYGLEHRVIWKLVYGSDPQEVDHINGNREDNRIENLRSVSRGSNTKNKRSATKTKSVHPGVRWYERRNKWVVGIGHRGEWLHLGYFAALPEALAARKAAEKKYGFHPNHGRE